MKKSIRGVLYFSLMSWIVCMSIHAGTYSNATRLGTSLRMMEQFLDPVATMPYGMPNELPNGFQDQVIGGADFLSLEDWLDSQVGYSVQALFNVISPSDSLPGVVIASPSRENPDYYYHWVRDAALTFDVMVQLHERSKTPEDRLKYSSKINDFVYFSRRNQLTPNLSQGLGEPKFRVDGTAFNGDWGRPQNDGPALRAITLIRYAKGLIRKGSFTGRFAQLLYDSKLPTHSVIKSDLEYVSYHWQESSFDIWEETRGHHFYTRMVQRKALLQGAELADLLGDFGASFWYRKQAMLLEKEVVRHWDSSRKILVATLGRDGGNSSKVSGLDVAVVLGALHGDTKDGFFSPANDQLIATAFEIQKVFQSIYPINPMIKYAPAIGRYPEDIYDGYSIGVHLGNPWVLATFAYSELYSRIASEWVNQGFFTVSELNSEFLNFLTRDIGPEGRFQLGQRVGKDSSLFHLIVRRLREEADSFLMRVKYHTPMDGSYWEQMNRTTGFMQGAKDLAWSYDAFLTAYWARSNE